MLLDCTADINVKSEYEGETGLISAAKYGYMNVVELLLEHNADVNASDNGGYTALINAAKYGYKETVELLLQYNSNVNSKTIYGETGLILAARYGYKDVVHLLLEHNADGNTMQNHDGRKFKRSTNFMSTHPRGPN